MKEFAIYTLLRLGLFVAVLALVLGVWVKVLGEESSLIWPLLIAFLLSGVISVFLLDKPRESFARKVEDRAQRAAARVSEKYDEMRTKEDDLPPPSG